MPITAHLLILIHKGEASQLQGSARIAHLTVNCHNALVLATLLTCRATEQKRQSNKAGTAVALVDIIMLGVGPSCKALWLENAMSTDRLWVILSKVVLGGAEGDTNRNTRVKSCTGGTDIS